MSGEEKYKWFIAHVSYRNEGNVANLLDIAGLEYYMPFKKVARTWNNILKEIEVPVIPTCTFIRVDQSDVVMLRMMKELSLMMDADKNPLYISDERMGDLRKQLDASDNPGDIILQVIEQFV